MCEPKRHDRMPWSLRVGLPNLGETSPVPFLAGAAFVHVRLKFGLRVEVLDAPHDVLALDAPLGQEVVELAGKELVGRQAVLEVPPDARVQHSEQLLRHAGEPEVGHLDRERVHRPAVEVGELAGLGIRNRDHDLSSANPGTVSPCVRQCSRMRAVIQSATVASCRVVAWSRPPVGMPPASLARPWKTPTVVNRLSWPTCFSIQPAACLSVARYAWTMSRGLAWVTVAVAAGAVADGCSVL